jgi:parallel beta-helix repeat protein
MKKLFTITLFLIILISTFTFILPNNICIAAGENLFVGPGQTYSTIQAAIDAANESDTIHVYSGTYIEYLEIDKSVTITGEGSGTKTIQWSAGGKPTIKITSDSVTITGFSIKNSGGETNQYSCVYLDSVTNCNIQDNTIQNAGSGVYLVDSNSITVSDNTISNNNNDGVKLTNSDGCLIYANTIQNNGNGVFLSSGSTGNRIYENTISSNTYGINTHISNDNWIYLNHFQNSYSYNAYDESSNFYSYNNNGNYWDDYTGVDEDPQDDIGDTPYNVPGGSNQDQYVKGDFDSQSQNPVAIIDSISPNPATVGETVTFLGHGTPVDSIVDWEWKIGDSVVATSEDFTKADLAVGTYSVYYRVKHSDNTWSSYSSASVTINSEVTQENRIPFAVIDNPSTPVTKYYGETITFQGRGYDLDGDSIIGYNWRLEEGTILSGNKQFSKSDLAIGNYRIYFKVKDENGQWSSEEQTTVTIIADPDVPNNPPTAVAGGPYSGIVNQSITFDASASSDPDEGDTLIYSWYFGDGNNSQQAVVDHSYSSVGEYTATLTVTDSYGETSTVSTIVNITQDSEDDYCEECNQDNMPGFELIILIIAALFVYFIKRKKK